MFELQTIQEQIAQLIRDINCIKTGDCCTGGATDTTIFSDSGTFGTGRTGNITDTLTFRNLAGDTDLNTFYESGNVSLAQNVGLVGLGTIAQAAKLHIKGNATVTNGFTPDEILLRVDDSADIYRVRVHAGGKTYFNVTTVNSSAVVILAGGTSYTALQAQNTTTTLSQYAYGGTITVATSVATPNLVGVYANTNGLGVLRNIGGLLETLSSEINNGFYDDGVTIYNTGLRAAASERPSGNVDFIFGGNFSAGSEADLLTTVTGAIIGIHSEAVARQTLAATILIGGLFRTRDTTPVENVTLTHIALLVPSTDNFGTVVFGADNVSVNKSMLEVTGDVEVIGNGLGYILQSPDLTRWRIEVDNAGVVSSSLA